MERVNVSAGETGDDGAIDRHQLGSTLGTTDVAINRYQVAPGEELPAGLHAHHDQEELFIVLAGEATFWTLEETITVGTHAAVRFAPGEYKMTANEGETSLELLALGAPRESNDISIPVTCPSCGDADLRLDGEGGFSFVCPVCSAERTPVSCPGCGGDDLKVVPATESRSSVACQDCDERFDRPPVEEGW